MSLSALHVFCRVMELSSFRQAADSLQIPVATASSQIKSLELRLGVRLLTRSSRHVAATDEGLAYYQRVAPLIEGLNEADQALKDTQAAPRGRLHVTVPASLMRLVIAPHLPQFQNLYPQISLRLVATDQIVDLAADGLDCAIRAGKPAADGLAVTVMNRLPQFFAASPKLVAQFGVPESLQDLKTMPFLNYASCRDSMRIQVKAYMNGKLSTFEADAPTSIDDGCAYVEMACAGLGVIQSPAYDLNPQVTAGRLQFLLVPWQGPEISFHAVYGKGRACLPRVVAFVEWVASLLEKPEFVAPRAAIV